MFKNRFKNLRLTCLFVAMPMLASGFTGCADEGDEDALPALNGADRGILGLKVLFSQPGSETLTYEVARRGEVVLQGEALMQGQSAVGLKVSGLFVGSEYSVSVVATGSRTSMVCRGMTENWEIVPGTVTTVEVAMACANE